MYNSSSTIVKCLDSVLNQTYQDSSYEVIIVNDGSKDNSKEIVESYIKEYLNPNYKIILINQTNGGVSKARNTGLQYANGDFIALLDSDDEWLPDKLDRQISVINEGESIDFLGCSRNGEQLKIFGKRIDSLHKASVKELLLKMFPQTSTAIFKKEVYLRNGGYNENMTHGEDGEFWVRICSNSNFYYLPESLVITGSGKPSFGHSGLSANLKAMQKGNEYIIQQALKNKLIGYTFYYFLMFFYKFKYLRRIIITKIR